MHCLADDIVVFAKSEVELDFLLQQMNAICTRWGFKISISKTNILVVARGARPTDPKIRLNEDEIPVVTDAKYLGSWYSNNGSIEKEINVRIGAAWVPLAKCIAFSGVQNLVLKRNYEYIMG
jgi:hypothetical protein